MPRAQRACPTPGCPNTTSGGRCPGCVAAAALLRGTPADRGYGTAHRVFRRAVLRRDPICVHPDGCTAPSEHADHWPLSLRELRALGLNPYDPARGRGLCQHHHMSDTARLQPGGWNAR
jgi:5-methylcytosine-specific restriction protein A